MNPSSGSDSSGLIKLCDNIVMFPNITIGQRDNVYEGEVRSSVYGVRPCVIKFATISKQNVREAEILNKLGSHTNIIAIIQSGIYQDFFEDRFYIALDKCHNENLRQYLSNRKEDGVAFDLNRAIDFAKQLIAGVMYIHENNIVHLDLKPSNILISQNLRLIKIADFGLSIVVKSAKSKVFHKGQFGTNGYRPIESFGNGIVSQRTDIFSLGTVLLHLLSNGNDVFGCDKHVFVFNVMNDVTDTSGLLVCNPVSTEHLIKCMVNKERCRRPTIWEVSDHPCWSENEGRWQSEYFVDDENDDTEGADAAYRIPTTTRRSETDREFLKKMREMGFNRKPTLVLFERNSRCLYLYNQRNSTMTKMHEYPTQASKFSVVSHDEYIYVLQNDRSVCRLEYGDVTATWERMNDWVGDHGSIPPAVVSPNGIFLVGVNHRMKGKRSLSMYKPLSGQWERLNDKPLASNGSALACNNEYLYCIGGLDESGAPSNRVERMELKTRKWVKIVNMKRVRYKCCAVEYRGNIYVVPIDGKRRIIGMYDPIIDRWAEIEPLGDHKSPIIKGFSIDDDFLLLSANEILKYDVKNNKMSVVSSYAGDNMVFQDAAVVTISAPLD